MHPPIPPLAYQDNGAMFADFYALQRGFSAGLSAQPDLVRAWLGSRPAPERGAGSATEASRGWRTARLSACRRGQLAALIELAAGETAGQVRLAAWLLTSLPVGSLLEISALSGPVRGPLQPETATCCRHLIALRNRIFLANYGLAKAAASAARSGEFDERLSAACSGLLDAVDRYVPGERAARFAFFATYWIRYHVSRQLQKQSSVVSFPIHQQRIVRKIDRLMADRRGRGLPEPSSAEVRSELDLGADAYARHFGRPRVVSIQGGGTPPEGKESADLVLYDPAPCHATMRDGDVVVGRIRHWLKTSVPPATRVILAYAQGIGPLPEAALEYLEHLREIARERLRSLPT